MTRRWALPIFGWGLLAGALLKPTLDLIERRAGYKPGRPTGRLHP